MMDVGEPDLAALGVSGPLQGAGALALYWTLGPAIRSMGRVFGEWTDYRLRNLLLLGDKVSNRISKDYRPDGQTVNPRVAKLLIDEASWIEDDLHQEYLAGLLISSRSPDGTSDDGAYFARIVAGLSASQVRLHFGIYNSYYGTNTVENVKHNFNGGIEDRHALAVWAPRQSYLDVASGLAEQDQESAFAAGVHGLEREGLVEQCAPPTQGHDDVVTIPSLLGALIFHRALGYTAPGIDAIRSDRAQLARIDPNYTFAELTPEPLSLSSSRISPSGV
jgi:hypothetical protein